MPQDFLSGYLGGYGMAEERDRARIQQQMAIMQMLAQRQAQERQWNRTLDNDAYQREQDTLTRADRDRRFEFDQRQFDRTQQNNDRRFEMDERQFGLDVRRENRMQDSADLLNEQRQITAADLAKESARQTRLRSSVEQSINELEAGRISEKQFTEKVLRLQLIHGSDVDKAIDDIRMQKQLDLQQEKFAQQQQYQIDPNQVQAGMVRKEMADSNLERVIKMDQTRREMLGKRFEMKVRAIQSNPAYEFDPDAMQRALQQVEAEYEQALAQPNPQLMQAEQAAQQAAQGLIGVYQPQQQGGPMGPPAPQQGQPPAASQPSPIGDTAPAPVNADQYIQATAAGNGPQAQPPAPQAASPVHLQAAQAVAMMNPQLVAAAQAGDQSARQRLLQMIRAMAAQQTQGARQ